MNSAPRLYQLQLIDLELESKKELLRAIEEKFGESEKLLSARDSVSTEEAMVASLEKQQRDLEWQAEDLRDKIKPLEVKLYGGTVKNSKELSSMQQEIDQFKARMGEIEDAELEIMSKGEEQRHVLATAKEDLLIIERSWKDEQASLSAERDSLCRDIEQLESRRNAAAAQISPQDVAVYDNLRVRKGGKAVAKVERGTCQGCRISLPMTDVQRLRNSEQFVYCSSCGRILFLS